VSKSQQLPKLLSNIFTRISYKISFSNKKINSELLPIDALKTDVKNELLFITTSNVEKVFSELSTRKFSYAIMQKYGDRIFLQLIMKTLTDFLNQQYGTKVKLNSLNVKNSLYVKTLLSDSEIIFKLPFYTILDSKAPDFLLKFYPVYTYASENFIEALLDNLIIAIGNCVIYNIALKLSSLSAFRQTLYRTKFLSIRNFEQYKNNLIWQAQVSAYITVPISCYSSQYTLLVLRTTGICSKTVYANRSRYLNSLTNTSLVTVTAIEFKDFIVGRLEELIYFLSVTLRFTLTNVIGQFIGLIWRGVIDGLKNKNNDYLS